MDKIWFAHYQSGVPTAIDPDHYQSLNDFFQSIIAEHASHKAFYNMGVSYTYHEIEQQAKAFAAYLQSDCHLKKGDRFAVMMPNILQYPIVVLGIILAGGCVVNVNPLYTPSELTHQLKDSGASGIVILENFAKTLQTALQKTPLPELKYPIVTKIGDVFPVPKKYLVNFIVKYIKKIVPGWILPGHIQYTEALRQGTTREYTDPNCNHHDIAFLQYTGGTTGRSKGAMLTHRNIIANVQQASSWLVSEVIPRQEIIITALPLYHIFSLTANFLTFFMIGATNVLITNPRDIKGFIKELGKFQFTAITGVNTLFNALLNDPKFSQLDFSCLKIALGGGMAVQASVASRWKAATGQTLIEAYGLTETSPAACINPINLPDYNGSVGLPIASTEVSIRNEEGVALEAEEEGELWIRGPQVMQGYWNQPEETQNALTHDGWFKTGDIATQDKQGYVRIVDRKKDMILVSGFNVYPNEVEAVISQLDGVLEVAVIGIPDEIKGELAKAFIVRKDQTLTESMVVEYCKVHLTAYKVPKVIEFRTELPKTNVGKILRRALKEQAFA